MPTLSHRLVPVKPVIYSVRHGESIFNVNRGLYERISDPAGWLTELGQMQAHRAGEFLAEHFAEMPLNVRPQKIRILRSFYRRAIQTAENIETSLRCHSELIDTDISVKEESRLRELEFGYGGYLTEPFEPHDLLSDQLRYQGYKFLAPRLGGESPAHMENRVRSVLGAIFRDFEENGITHFIVVGHGITNRVLTYARYNKSNKWYEQEPNPDNCAIRLMADEDLGYIFPNVTGQWDENWTPELGDAGDPHLNPKSKFFSPQEMKALMEIQPKFPDIVKDVVAILDNPDSLHRDFHSAVRAAVGAYT